MKVALGTATSPKVVKTVTVGKTVTVCTIISPTGNISRVGGRGGHSGSSTNVVAWVTNAGVGVKGMDVSKLTVGTWSSVGITVGAVLRLVILGGKCPTLSREDATDPRLEKGTSLFSIALNSAWALLQSVALSNTNGAVVTDGTSSRQGTEGVSCDSF